MVLENSFLVANLPHLDYLYDRRLFTVMIVQV